MPCDDCDRLRAELAHVRARLAGANLANGRQHAELMAAREELRQLEASHRDVCELMNRFGQQRDAGEAKLAALRAAVRAYWAAQDGHKNTKASEHEDWKAALEGALNRVIEAERALRAAAEGGSDG